MKRYRFCRNIFQALRFVLYDSFKVFVFVVRYVRFGWCTSNYNHSIVVISVYFLWKVQKCYLNFVTQLREPIGRINCSCHRWHFNKLISPLKLDRIRRDINRSVQLYHFFNIVYNEEFCRRTFFNFSEITIYRHILMFIYQHLAR